MKYYLVHSKLNTHLMRVDSGLVCEWEYDKWTWINDDGMYSIIKDPQFCIVSITHEEMKVFKENIT